MACPRFALRLLLRADDSDDRGALIGDLLEEIAAGRSRWWIYRQVIGVYGFALAARARDRARLTPGTVALALLAVLLGGASISSAGSVVEAWFGFYALAGTLSLFGHMMARAQVR